MDGVRDVRGKVWLSRVGHDLAAWFGSSGKELVDTYLRRSDQYVSNLECFGTEQQKADALRSGSQGRDTLPRIPRGRPLGLDRYSAD